MLSSNNLPVRLFDSDVSFLVRFSPYLRLARLKSATTCLQHQATTAERCRPILKEYPQIRAEPLEFFYTCLFSLGALQRYGSPLFSAMVSENTWRGFVWGSWLALLSPNPAYVSLLQSTSPNCSENAWLAHVALCSLQNLPVDPTFSSFYALACRCRLSLQNLSLPQPSLRLAPTADDFVRMDQERQMLRAIYKQRGSNAARSLLPKTLVGYYAQDYEAWRRSGSPDKP